MNKDSYDLDNLHKKKQALLNDRSYIELWCDKYNHTFSLLRTIFGLMNILIASLIAFKVFGVIWMEKVVCNCCSTKYGRRYMILRCGFYDCGCGYSVSQKSYKGDMSDNVYKWGIIW